MHFRVYPVIYALPLFVFLHHEHYPFLCKPSEITSMWSTAIVRFFAAAGALPHGEDSHGTLKGRREMQGSEQRAWTGL